MSQGKCVRYDAQGNLDTRAQYNVDWRQMWRSYLDIKKGRSRGNPADAADFAQVRKQCEVNATVFSDPRVPSLQSAPLRCVAALYHWNWAQTGYSQLDKSGSDDAVKGLFRDDDPTRRPYLTFSFVNANRRDDHVPLTDEKRSWNAWVIRQSPHMDKEISVCPGANVWLEVAEHPRRRMPKLNLAELRLDKDHLGGDPKPPSDAVKNQDDYPSYARVIRQVGLDSKSTEMVQYPAFDNWLEPWETILLIGITEPNAQGGDPCARRSKSAMPTLTASALSAAIETLRARGFPNASVVPAKDDEETLAELDLKVVGQYPAPKSEVVSMCTPVTLVVERRIKIPCDAHRTYMPPLGNLLLEDAQQRLRERGLKAPNVSKIAWQPSDVEADPGTWVLAQYPPAGTQTGLECDTVLLVGARLRAKVIVETKKEPYAVIGPTILGAAAAAGGMTLIRRRQSKHRDKKTPPDPTRRIRIRPRTDSDDPPA